MVVIRISTLLLLVLLNWPCPAFADQKTDLQLPVIYFAYDRLDLDARQTQKLSKLAAVLHKHQGIELAIIGHTDERGTDEYNIHLGERMAEAVRQVLINKGVSAERLRTISYGEERPVDLNHNEQAWDNNRRVEFRIRQ